MNPLTLQELKDMRPKTIFAQGEVINSPDDIYMTDTNIGRKMIWVAKRGGIYDWAIYIHWADKGIDFVERQGDKIRNKKDIQKLVPCDKEALEMYRY